MPSDLKDKGLYSCMNNTKWIELRDAMMNEMPFQPQYIIKYVFDDEVSGEESFTDAVYSGAGSWYEVYALDKYFQRFICC